MAFNYYLDRALVHSPEVAGVAGCPGSSGRVPALSQNDIEVGGTWRVTLTGAPGSSLTALAVDVGGGLLPAPLPLGVLIGGASSACQVGIPTNGTSEILTTVADGSGFARWTNTIPANRSLWLRTPISIQAVSIDFFAPGGVIVSDALQRDVGIKPAMTVIAAQGDPANVVSGSLNRNYGIVTMFEHQ